MNKDFDQINDGEWVTVYDRRLTNSDAKQLLIRTRDTSGRYTQRRGMYLYPDNHRPVHIFEAPLRFEGYD
jgi:hypothetical protein